MVSGTAIIAPTLVAAANPPEQASGGIMVAMIAQEVAPGRWRAAAGGYFEDFTAGDIYENRPGRTIRRGRQYSVYAADNEPAPAALRQGLRGSVRTRPSRGQQLSDLVDCRRTSVAE